MSSPPHGSSEANVPAFGSPPAAGDRTAAVRAGRTAMSLDAPSSSVKDVPLKLPIRIMGWAYSRSGIEHVTITVDEKPVRAVYGLVRSDVAEALSEPDAARSGFTALIGSDLCEPGPHQLSAIAVDRDQRATGMTVSFVAEPPDGAAAPATGPESSSPSDADNEAERYVPEVHRGLPMEAEHQARYNWSAALARGRDVLDAGCGVGWGTVLLARSGARSTVGVDISEEALGGARDRAGDKAEFVRGDLLDLPFEENAFDLVVSFEAIEHVGEPLRALDEFRRVLRPGGMLALSSPNRGVYPSGNPFHLHELTSSELEAALRERFPRVAMYRQETHIGSLVADDSGHAADDPFLAIDARLYKMWGRRPGDELYTIALAGEGDLPEMPGVAVLSAPLDTRHFHEQIARLEQQALLNEAKAAAAEGALRALAAETERAKLAEARLAQYEASVSWRVTKPLRAGRRAVLRFQDHDTP